MTAIKFKPYDNTNEIKGISFPAGIKFRQILISGPPGSGKSTLSRRLGGWSEEGYVDLAQPKWWASQSLSLRPREIHLGIPFEGFSESLAVFEKKWLSLDPSPSIDFGRICIPPEKKYFFSVNWRSKYAFEFLLPPADVLFHRRVERMKKGTHHVDEGITIENIERQLYVYKAIAVYLVSCGVCVYFREDIDAPPMQIFSGDKES